MCFLIIINREGRFYHLPYTTTTRSVVDPRLHRYKHEPERGNLSRKMCHTKKYK